MASPLSVTSASISMSGKTRKAGAHCIFTCVTAAKYNKRKGKNSGRGLIPNRVDIDQRPSVVAAKSRIGDWEADTIIGANHRGAVMSHVERKSKYTKLAKLRDKSADSVVRACACFCRSPTASKQSPTTMEKSSPLTSRSQPRWGHYPILPNPITRGNAASTNTPTAYSDSTSQRAQISLLCQIPMSKRSRINSTLAPERYSVTPREVFFNAKTLPVALRC